MRRLSVFLMAILLSLTLMPLGALAAIVPVEGASFTEVTDVGGIAGSTFYLYKPSELYNPGPMLTSVIYVYGDQPFADAEDAWRRMNDAGLADIAEAEHGAVIMVNRVGDAYDRDDVDLFEAMMAYIFFADGTEKLTWHNLQYAIGEGAGSTFINNYLTQNCKRIAAVLTFGGEIATPYPLYPLPAYIVSGSQEAIDYYIRINARAAQVPNSGRDAVAKQMVNDAWAVTQTEEKTTHVYTADPVKKVMVSKQAATSFDRAIIADAWNSLFRRTARACLTANFWNFKYTENTYNTAEYTLYARPDYATAGMDVIKVDGLEQRIWEQDAKNYWYEFIPAAVKAEMENKTGQTFPLMVCFHGGGDHPIYEAESIGWSQLCIDNNVIMVSPNGSGADESKALIEYMIAKYPVDVSRIYAGGFSGGARSTLRVSNAYPELFAAVSPMSCVSGPFYTDLCRKIAMGEYNYDLDLPIAIIGQGMETESTDWNGQYVWYDAVQTIMNLNEVPQPGYKLDFEQYPYWGFPVADNKLTLPATGFGIWHGVIYDKDGIPMVAALHSESVTHTHYPAYAELIWDWFEDFTRNPITKQIRYSPIN